MKKKGVPRESKNLKYSRNHTDPERFDDKPWKIKSPQSNRHASRKKESERGHPNLDFSRIGPWIPEGDMELQFGEGLLSPFVNDQLKVPIIRGGPMQVRDKRIPDSKRQIRT